MASGALHPIKWVGSQVARPGNTHSKRIASTMHIMKGKAPFRIVGRLTSGVMPLMTNSQ